MRALYYAALTLMLVTIWFILTQVIAVFNIAVWTLAWFIRNGVVAVIIMAAAYGIYKVLRSRQ